MLTKKHLIFGLFLLIFFILTPAIANASNPIPAGDGPYSVLANPVDHELYVANYLSDNISFIDTLTDTNIATENAGPPSFYRTLALAQNPNTGRLYAANFWDASLTVIDLSTYTREALIPNVGYGMGGSPRAVVVNPNTDLVYVSTIGANGVYVIDGDPASPTFNTVLTNILVGLYARSAAINTTLNRLYVANTNSDSVSVIDIDPASINYHTVIATIGVGSQPYGIAVNQATGKVYTTNQASNNVSVINGVTNTLIKNVSVGTYPRSLAINSDRNEIYIANKNSANVTVIDGSSDTAITPNVSVGVNPVAVTCINSTTGSTFVTNYDDDTVTEISSDLSTTTTTATGNGPFSLSIDTLLAKPQVYVGNYEDDNVSVIDPPAGSSTLTTSINSFPGNTTSDTTPTFTGTSTSSSSPYAGRINKVFFLIDTLDSQWNEATITAGWGTSSVSWEFTAPSELTEASHTVYVMAQDMTGATISSLDGTLNNTPGIGDVSSYSFSVSTVDDQPPTIPQNLSATAVSTSQINLSWDASTDNVGVTGYEIYNASNDNLIDTTANTSYSHSSLSADTTYGYYVKAKDAADNPSGASATAQATTFNTATGDNVVVDLGHNVEVTFGNTSQEGETSVSLTDNAPANLPGGFQVTGLDASYFEINSTATFSGKIEVKIKYDPAKVQGSEENLQMLHWTAEAGWENCTKSVDTVNKYVIGEVDHFSVFATGEYYSGAPTGVNKGVLLLLGSLMLITGVILRRRYISSKEVP